MKLKLNKSLRMAVLACMAAVMATTVQAASIDYNSYSDDLKANLVYANNFEGDTPQVDTITFNPGPNASGGTALVNNNNVVKARDLGDTFKGTGFTVSMDLNVDGFANWKNLFTILINNTDIQVQKTGSAAFAIYGINATGANNENPSPGISTTDLKGMTTLTIVLDATANTLAFYLDGEQKSLTELTFNDGVTPNYDITGFAIGAAVSNADRNSGSNITLDNLSFWNTALTSTQVNSLLVKFPEATVVEGTTTAWAALGFEDTAHVKIKVTPTEAADDFAHVTVSSAVTVGQLDATGGALSLDIEEGGTFTVSSFSGLRYAGKGTLALVENASVNDNTTFAAMEGTIDVAAGKTLSMGNGKSADISLGSGKVVLHEGSTLSLFANNSTLDAAVEMDNATIHVPDGQNSYTFTNGITLTGDNKITSDWGKTFNLNGLLSGDGSITFHRTTGNETAVANLTQANTYKGTTTINGAFRVVLSGAGSLGEGGLTMAAASNQYGELVVDTDTTIHGISGTGKITINAEKVLTLDADSTFSRGNDNININMTTGGTLKLAAGVTLSGYDGLTLTGKDGGEGTAKASADSTGKVELATGSGDLTYENVVLTIASGDRNVSSKFVNSDLVFEGNGTLNLRSEGFSLRNLSATNATAVNVSGTGSISGALNLGAMLNNTGNLTISSNIVRPTDYSNFESEAGVYTDTQGNASTNGYLSSNFTIIKSAEGATLTVDGDLADGLVLKDNSLFVHDADNTTYIINENVAYTTGDVANVTTGHIKVAEGGTLALTADESVATGVDVMTEGTGKVSVSGGTVKADAFTIGGNTTLELAADTTLTKGTLANNGHTLTLTGDGRYEIGNSMALDATLAADWTGTVAIKGLAFSGNPRFGALKDLATADSWIELDSCTGYLYRKSGDASPTGYPNNDGNLELATNLILAEGTALTITNGNTGRTALLSGKIKGTGDIKVNAGNPDNMHTAFTGDTSEWTGDFIMAYSKNHYLEFTGNADISNGNITATAGTLHVTIGGEATDDVTSRTISSVIAQDGGTVNLTLNGTCDKVFEAAVSAKTLSISGGVAAFKDALTVNGAVSVAKDSKLDLSAATAVSMDTLTVAAGSALGLGGAPVALNQLTLTGVSDELKIAVTGVKPTDEPLALFTGLVSEDKITGIEFETLRGKRAVNAGNYFAGLEDAWLVYSEADSTLSIVDTLSKSFHWVGGDGTWNADGISWAKTEGGEPTNAFTPGESAIFDGGDAVVTLDGAAGATDMTFSGGNYTLKGEAAHIDGNIRVENATAVFETAPVLGEETAVRLTGAESSLKLAGDASITALNNEGTLDMDGHDLSIAAGTENGGTVKAGNLQLAGDNTFTLLTATGAVTGADSLTLGDGSSMGSISGETDLTVAGGTVTIQGNSSIKSLVNNGTLDLGDKDLTIAAGAARGGVLKAGNLTLAGDNTFTLLTASGKVTGADSLTLGNGSSAGSINGGDLTVAGGTVTVKGDSSIDALENNGTLDLGDKALTIATGTAKGGVLKAGNVTLAGDNTFTKLTASGTVSGATSLTVGDGSSMGAISGGALTVAGGTVTVKGDSSIGALENNGTLDLGDKALSISTGTAKGGTVKAGNVTLAGDNTFDKLTASGKVSGADSLTLGGGSSMGSISGGALTVAGGTVTVKGNSSIKALENNGTLDLGGKDLDIATGTAKGGIVKAGNLKLAGANTFSELTASGEVSGASSLTLGNSSSMGSMGTGTALTINKGTTTIGAATSLKALENHGTLDLGGKSLAISTGTAKGGIVKAGSVKLAGDNTFSHLTASGAVTGASSLTLGGDSSMGSVSNGTKLTVAGGSTAIGSSTTLSALAVDGALTVDGDLAATELSGTGSVDAAGNVALTEGGSITSLTVGGGTLTLGGVLSVSDELAGVDTLVADTLPTSGPALTAGSMTGDTFTLNTTESALDSIDIAGDDTWVLAQIGDLSATEFFISLNGAEASSFVSYNDFRYSLVAEDGNILISRVRSGNEWRPGSGVFVWDGSDDMWTAGAPSADRSAFFLGSGSSQVVVVGTQTAKSIIVDTEGGRVEGYTLMGDAVRTGSLLVGSGSLTLENEVTVSDTIASGSGIVTVGGKDQAASLTVGGTGDLTAKGIEVSEVGSLAIAAGGHVVTESISFQDGAGFSNEGYLEITDGNLALKQLADNKGTVSMKSLKGGNDATIGGHIILQEGGSYTGAYKPGTQVDVEGAGSVLKQAADANLSIGGSAGTHILSANADRNSLTAVRTTGADIVLHNTSEGKTATIKLGEKSSMKGGKLTLAFSAARAAKNSGIKSAVDKTFTGAALALSGVDITLTQLEAGQAPAITLGDTTQDKDVVIYTISDAAGSTFDSKTTLTVEAPLLDKYFNNFHLQQGSINVVADRELNYYGKHLTAKSRNGRQGLAIAGQALGRLAPQEGANRDKHQDIAAVLDALDRCVETGDNATADKLGAAFAGSAVTATASAFSSDMDRQLRSLRNRTMIMGASDSLVMEPGLPSLWFNAEGDYRRVAADGMAAGFTLSNFGATVGSDYNINCRWTVGLAATAMYGHMSVSSPEDSVKGNLDTYYASFIVRYAKGRWSNSFIGTFGIADATLDRTVDTGAGSYTTDGSTSGTAFGLLYELAYTIPMNADASFCLQPVANVSYKHVGIKSYMEKKSDAGLAVGNQTMDALTLGAGARMQTTLGETLLNRTTVLEARALAKVEVGDHSSSADVSLAVLPGNGGTVKGAKSDVFGLEVGAGLFVPVGVDSGTLFFDVSAEFRKNSPNVTGTVGYRITF